MFKFVAQLNAIDGNVWTLLLTRIVDEMSPAYLVFVGVIYVAVKLAYKYISKKIEFSLDKEKSFLILLQEALRVISVLDDSLDQLHGKIDNLRSDHEEIIDRAFCAFCAISQQDTPPSDRNETIQSVPKKPRAGTTQKRVVSES